MFCCTAHGGLPAGRHDRSIWGNTLLMADRRQFLGWGFAAAGSCMVAGAYAPSARAASDLRLTTITPRLSLVEGAAANIVVASSGSELLLVDGGAAADAKSLQALLAERFPKQPIRAVFNTHWHWNQTGFNATARKLGVDVLCHENTRLWLTTEVNSRWEQKIYKPQPKAAWPNRSFFYDAQSLDFGGSKVEYVHLGQAHTDGDIYVRFPDDNVIVAGDVLAPGRYPVIDTATNGYLGGINIALRTMLALGDANTRYVPGTGPVSGPAAVQLQQEMGSTVITRLSDNSRKGGTFAEFVASKPTSAFDDRLGDPSQFLKLAYDSADYQTSPMGGLPAAQPAPGAGRQR
jgi:cyclase